MLNWLFCADSITTATWTNLLLDPNSFPIDAYRFFHVCVCVYKYNMSRRFVFFTFLVSFLNLKKISGRELLPLLGSAGRTSGSVGPDACSAGGFVETPLPRGQLAVLRAAPAGGNFRPCEPGPVSAPLPASPSFVVTYKLRAILGWLAPQTQGTGHLIGGSGL